MKALQRKQVMADGVREAPTGSDEIRLEVVPDLEQLFRKYAAYVAAIAHGLIGSPQDVDDIVQDVFLDVERGLSGVRDYSAIKGWLATIAVRRSRKYLKKRRFRQYFGIGRAAVYDEVADASASPEQRAMVTSIYRILDGFSPDDRIAWTLKYVHGEKVSDVAKLCGCSRATAHRRIASVQAVINETVDE